MLLTSKCFLINHSSTFYIAKGFFLNVEIIELNGTLEGLETIKCILINYLETKV